MGRQRRRVGRDSGGSGKAAPWPCEGVGVRAVGPGGRVRADGSGPACPWRPACACRQAQGRAAHHGRLHGVHRHHHSPRVWVATWRRVLVRGPSRLASLQRGTCYSIHDYQLPPLIGAKACERSWPGPPLYLPPGARRTAAGSRATRTWHTARCSTARRRWAARAGQGSCSRVSKFVQLVP